MVRAASAKRAVQSRPTGAKYEDWHHPRQPLRSATAAGGPVVAAFDGHRAISVGRAAGRYGWRWDLAIMTSRGPRRTPGAVIGDVQEMVVRSNSWRRAQGKGDGSWARGSLVVRLDTGWAGSGVEQEKGRPLASSHTDSIRERYPEKLALSRPRRLSRRAADPVSACARQITALEEAPPPPSAALDAAQRGDVLCYFRVCSVLGAPGVVGRELTTDAVRSAATNTTGTTTTHDSVLVQERRRAGPPSQRLLAGLVVSSRRGSLTQLVSSSTAGVMIKPACCACSVLKQPSRPDVTRLQRQPRARPP